MEKAQDLYFILGKVPGFMKLGDDRRFVQSFLAQGDMTAIISHFKFVAGMNVGEKRRISWGRVVTLWRMGGLDSLVDSGDYRGYESGHSALA